MAEKKILFRASKIGALMTGRQGLTENQTARLHYLQIREKGHAAGEIEPGKKKPWAKLTPNMEAEMADLIDTRDAPFELTKTAKSFVVQKWLFDKYRFKKVVVTKEIMKGRLCEQDAFELMDEVLPASELRHKNRKSFSNEFTKGTPDVTLFDDGYVDDAKCSWDLSTFVKVEEPSIDYFAQGQSYMDLTGLRRFRLVYCLVDTPNVLLQGEVRSLFFKYNAIPVHGILDDDDEFIIEPYRGEVPEELLEDIIQIKRNHIYSHIPAKHRVRVFEFDYSKEYVEEMKFRAEFGRKFYRELTLEKALQIVEI